MKGRFEEVDGVFRPREGYENYPVVEVSRYGASVYCSWFGARLPTEAEWEHAAPGPDATVYPLGDKFDQNALNYSETGFFGGREVRWMRVGSFPEGAGRCGALDKAGSVW
jgi:formylglycine-generating enzyme required for sulfatase activity